MQTYYKIFIILFLFPTCFSVAQTDSSYLKAEEVLENILQEPTREVDNSNLYELLEQLMQSPVNINQSEIADLQQIPNMDFKSAKLIVNYRKKYGNFFSVEELHAVRGLNKELIKQIIPFITVGKPTAVVQPEIKDENTIELLLSKTKLWILDEPLTALDVDGVKLVESMIVEHQKQGGSVVFTTHHGMELPCEMSFVKLGKAA